MTFKAGIRRDLSLVSDAELHQLSRGQQVGNPAMLGWMQDEQWQPVVQELANEEIRDRERQRVSAAYMEEQMQNELHQSFGIDDGGIGTSSNPGRLSGDPVENPPVGRMGVDQPVDSGGGAVLDTDTDVDLSEKEKAALLLHFISTTVAPLGACEPDDYQSACTTCSVSPIVDGPHHDEDCEFHSPFVRLDTANAHDSDCRHCEARPSVAGFHHEADCPRSYPTLNVWPVTDESYEVACDSCGVTPDSEGPHHDDECDAHASMPLYHTNLAHSGYCKECGALPFVAGPHHRSSCGRHVRGIPIPAGLVAVGESDGSE